MMADNRQHRHRVVTDAGTMTTSDVRQFVASYQEAWRTRDGEAFRRLWQPTGTLHHPNLSDVIVGAQVPAMNELLKQLLPDLSWDLLDWAARDATVFLEWRCRATVNDSPLEWRGVDRMVRGDERIHDEVVYCDTMPIWGAVDPTMRRPALIDASTLEGGTEADSVG
jgi:hypothetical protein